MVLTWILLLASTGFAIAGGALKLKESVHHPRGWLKRDRAPPSHQLLLKIGLPQPLFHVLERHLYEVSDPDHARYGQYLAKQDVEDLVAPHNESVTVVDEWLLSHGIDTAAVERSPAGDWITASIPVSVAETMLDTVN
jgi:tripeptidyl-peptidase-1